MKCLLRGTSISAESRFECHEGRAVRVVVPFLFYRLAKFKAVDAFTWKLISVFTAILDNVRLNEENFPFYVIVDRWRNDRCRNDRCFFEGGFFG